MKVKKGLRWLFVRWKMCLWVLAVGLSLVVFAVLLRGDRQTVETLSSQLAAERWETEEKPYALSTVFFTDKDGIPQTAVSEIRLNVENALTAAGVASDTHPWLYAFSRTEQAELKNGVAGTTVEMTLVAGDYFDIHPLSIRNGWYLDDSEVMRDRIILDRQTAWDLFYSDNVVGQYLEWNGQRYMVAAVVDTEPGKYNDLAAGDTQRAWAFADSPAADQSQGFTCAEMVLPQPVDGFGVSTLQSVLEAYLPEGTAAFSNSDRFSLLNRWDALRNIGTRWMEFQGIHYPYYENAARLVENHLGLRLVPEALFLGFPVTSLLIWLLMLNHKRTWGLHSIPAAIDRAVEKKRTRDYEARLRGEEPKKRKKRRRKEAPRRKYRPRDTSLDYSSNRYGITKRRR